MVDVVDSKSTASDGVPVRVRSPAPKKQPVRIAQAAFFASNGSSSKWGLLQNANSATGPLKVNKNFYRADVQLALAIFVFF